MKDRWQVVTPSLAEKLLEHNYKGQRSKRDLWTAQYASDMSDGRWNEDNPQPIILNSKGELIDGQHRLQAVIDSGVTIPFYFITVKDMSVYDVLDSGHMREVKDRGDWTNDTIALGRKIVSLDKTGKISVAIRATAGATQTEVISYLREKSDYLAGVVRSADKIRYKSGEVGAKSVFALFLHMAKVIYGDDIERTMLLNLDSNSEISLRFGAYMLKQYQSGQKPRPIVYAPAIARFYTALINDEVVRMYGHKNSNLEIWEKRYSSVRKGDN